MLRAEEVNGWLPQGSIYLLRGDMSFTDKEDSMSDNGYGYSKTILSQGLVCLNTNNNAYCVVIDGRKGTDDDRASLVLESNSSYGFILNTPPNRALIPT